MNVSASPATQSLLRRFRSQKPLRGGSLLITIFGDSLAPHGGVATLGSLIQLAAPFGLTERLVRTSMARLAQDGWLVTRRDGRRSEYRLTAAGRERFAEATQRIYGKAPETWSGHWTVLILPPGSIGAGTSARREAMREELRWLGFGQLGSGVFAHPNGNLEQSREWLRNLDIPREAILLRSSSDDLGVDREVVSAGWDLGGLARRYRRFVDSFAAVRAGLAGGGALAPEAAFVIRTLLIHDYRKIHLQDPLLPPALLPADWVGSSAYDLCANLYATVFGAAEEYLTATASTLDEALPTIDPVAYQRFGGIQP